MTEKTAARLRLRTPLEWIEHFVDADSFASFQPKKFAKAHEIVAGFASCNGRDVAVYAIDPDIDQGFITSTGALKLEAFMLQALEKKIPIVAFLASAGVSIAEGLATGDAYSRVIRANVLCSGQVPQIALITSVVMGAPSYSATLMDLCLFNKLRAHMMVSGPSVVAASIGERTTLGALGGAPMHATQTGLAHFVDEGAAEQLARAKWLIQFLPANGDSRPEKIKAIKPKVSEVALPAQMRSAFDITKLISSIVDNSEFAEYNRDFGTSIVTSFARIGGYAVGIVANQSTKLSGAIDARSAQKAARFIRLCDAYGVPILTLIDVPGYMPGSKEEQRGLLRHGAEMCRSMVTRVPKLSVVVRRCYGAAAFVLLQSAAQEGDLVLALDNSCIAVMGFDAAKHVVYKDRLDKEDVEDLRKEYYRDYESPEVARKSGIVDEVVKPQKLRERLIAGLEKVSRQKDKVIVGRGISP